VPAQAPNSIFAFTKRGSQSQYLMQLLSTQSENARLLQGGRVPIGFSTHASTDW